MYSDSKPCQVCGARVELRPHQTDEVAEPDGTIDERICTDPECETHRTDATP